MQEEELLVLYPVLGLSPGCSWDELRKAYRRQSRRWHPDRYALPSEHKLATEKMVAINHAYTELSRFYKLYDRLPSEHGPLVAESAFETDLRSTPTGSAAHRQPPFDRHGSDWTRASPPAKQRSRLRVAFAIVALGIAVAYSYGIHEAAQWGSHAERDDSTQHDHATSSHDDRGGNIDGIALGATPSEVIAVQGQPDHVDGRVWHFGSSRVFFSNGSVTGWDERPDSPLQLSAAARAPVPSGVTKFKKGSTMAMVRSIQGEPFRAHDTVWEYGPSRVYFKDGRVVSWYESPLMPLHIEQ